MGKDFSLWHSTFSQGATTQVPSGVRIATNLGFPAGDDAEKKLELTRS